MNVKTIIWKLSLWVGLLMLACCAQKNNSETKIILRPTFSLTTASFNVLSIDKDKYNSENFGGDIRTWDNRKSRIAQIIRENKFSVIGLQEISTDKMREDLKQLLPEYEFTKFSYPDPIYWLSGVFSRIDEGFFIANNGPYSLSEAPSSWARYVVWVRLKENKTGKELYVFNGHPVHYTDKASYRSAYAREIVRQEALINKDRLPVFITGDFNAYDERGADYESAKYNEIFGAAGYKNGMLTALTKKNETYGTWAGFGKPGNYAWLDRIYVKDGAASRISVSSYETIIYFDPKRPGYQLEPIPSDHFPIMIKATVQ